MFWKEYKDKQEIRILQKWGGEPAKWKEKCSKLILMLLNSFAECQQVHVSLILSLRVR